MSVPIGPGQSQFLQALFGQRLDPQALLNPEGATPTEGGQGVLGMTPQQQAQLNEALLAFNEGFPDLADAMKGHPALPAIASNLLAGLSGEDAMIAVSTLMNEAMDKTSKVTAESLKAQKDKLAATNQEKLDKIMEKIKQEKEAEPGFWSKLLGWVGKIVTAVVAVVAMVVGAALVATGAGAALGVALFALGGYMAAGVTVDVINEVRKAEGKEPLSWSPTLGQLAAVIAKAAGASEETANWIKMGVDIATDLVVGIAVSIMLPGAGVAIAAQRAGNALKMGKAIAAGMGRVQDGIKLSDTATKTLKAAKMADLIQGGVSATATIAKGAVDIHLAGEQKKADDMGAEVKEMVAKLIKLQAAIDELMGQVKDIEEKRVSTVKRCADTVAQGAENSAQIATNMGAPMA